MTCSSFHRKVHGLSLFGVALVLITSAGCGGSDGVRSPTTSVVPPGNTKHGRSLVGAAPQCDVTSVHRRHVSLFNCVVCHPTGATFGFDNAYAFPRGTTTAGGILVLHTDSTPTTCTVACHFPMGSTPKAVTWITPGPLDCTACHDVASTLAVAHPQVSPSATRADCQSCHDVSTHAVGGGAVVLVGHVPGWIDQTSPDFHASSANRGLANCKQCHAPDLTGGVTGFSCGQCHDQKDANGNVVVAWKANCVMCHGGANDQTGAPPKATWGHASDAVRVGAHGSHVTGSALAPPFDCSVCHVKPADALATGHIDEVVPGNVPLASVAFNGIAIQGLARQGITATWDRTTATCSSTYCHGVTLPGGTLKAPVWTTLDGSQAACGTCHGAPPPSPHPLVDVTGGLTACNPCHAGTVDASGAVIPPAGGGKHLDGVVEATGHPAAWMDTTSSGFHAYSADANIAACQGCHGRNLDGVGGTATTACAKCHDANLPTGVAGWKTNCVMCHGGTDNPSGAPPKAIWGYAGDPNRGGGTADPVRIGGHSAHVAGVSSGTVLSAPFDCGVCHVKPADALAAGHVNGVTASVTFSGLASQGTNASAPAWARDAATCSNVYCHGATLHGGTNTAPSWTGGTAQAACGTCHGVPPPSTTGHVQNTACGTCHPGYTQASVNPATHVNGSIDLVGLTCTTCHGDPARQVTAFNPQLAAAPPLDTSGNAVSAASGVGAHQAHLNDGPLGPAVACTECHTVPTSGVAHPTGTLVLRWGKLATSGGAVPSYSGGACSSTYCHGATLSGGSNTTPKWTGGSAEVACGTCHGVPPPNPHPTVSGGLTACNACHATTVDAAGAIIPANAGGTHIDGVIQAAGHSASWMDQTSPGFHAYSANQGLGSCQGCHGAALDGTGGIAAVACAQCHDQTLPAGVTSWKTNCVMCHGGTNDQSGAPPRTTWGNSSDLVRVGAHGVHVNGSAIAVPFDCAACHVKPLDALSSGHIDGATATVTWGGMATSGGAAPAWNRSSATCSSTYCHGNYAGVFNYTVWDWGLDEPIPMSVSYVGANSTPTWTGAAMTCSSCHGNPPKGTGGFWHSGSHGNGTVADGNECQTCHPDASSTNGVGTTITNTAQHVNGAVEVVPRFRSACFGCH